ncbi:MAG: hypothetical protein HKN41_00325, partial [Ilumatobacter sp.]|nr:hypothetical protein [Ilumatobacter sp.]
RRMLVVLDNCEHVTDVVADVVDVLLERTHDVAWLATSREPLQLPDERQVHVAPLAVADDPEAPAVQLFTAAAGRVGASIDPADAGRVAEICANLDGIPLSIELAAAQLRHLRLDELAARLDRRFDILTRSGGGRMRRQASLLAVLEDTWGMLDERETELLLLLAAFPSGFTVDAVEGISAGRDVGVPTATLAGLIDRSLIAGDGRGRHRLLETVKLFARQHWDAMDASADYLERHTAWVLGHLESYEPQHWFTSFEVYEWATSHYDDHRAVEDRLAAEARTSELASLMRGLTIAYTYGSGTRASAVIDRVERRLTALEFTARERGLLRLVAASAGLPARRPDVIASQSDAALEELRTDAAPEELAAALIVASWMRVFSDFPRAVAMLAEATSIADRADAAAIADAARAYTAGHTALVGRFDDAVAILDDLRDRLEGRPLDYAWSLHHLFRLALNIVADPRQARELADDLMKRSAIVAWDGGMGWGLPFCVGLTVAACGDVEGTRRCIAEAEAHARRTSDDDGLPDLLLGPAALAWRLGDAERARRWLTTVRRSPKPTANFQLTIMYRLLRNEVGLLDSNPLDEVEVHDVYVEAVEWLGSLEPINA